MPTAQELRILLDANTLSLNGVRTQLKELRNDRDFPHNVQKYLATANEAVLRIESELLRAKHSQKVLAERCNLEILTKRIEIQEAAVHDLQDAREVIVDQLKLAEEAEAALKGIKPELLKLEKLRQQMLTLPQEQLSELIASLTASTVNTVVEEVKA